MSGGSWNYFYQQLESTACQLAESREPMRKAFGNHLKKCAKALHDIEWVDSSDMSPGDENKAIRAVLGNGTMPLALDELKKDAQDALDRLERALENLKDL